jgi:2-isopropylmalate synthase
MSDIDAARKRRISIFDTTLRDGEQAPGNAMRPEQKVDLALRLEAAGVDVIEAGFPASSPSDYKALQLISQCLTSARFTSFCRAVREDAAVAVEAGGTRNHQIQVLATGSDLHLRHKRGISRQEAVREVQDTIRFASDLGVTDLSLGVEDASRGEPDLLRALIDGSLDAGCTTVAVADTAGWMLPAEFADLVHRVRSWVPPPVVLSVHCHDDLGLAVANTLAAVEAGADEAQVTVGGIGERAGNAALEEFVAGVAYRGDKLGVSTAIKTEQLYSVYQVLAQAISLEEQRAKAIFGTNAFATQAGIHQAGMLRNPETYEYLEPVRFGRERSILVGRHSGRVVLRHMLTQLGIPADEAMVNELYHEYIASRAGGECDELSVVRDQIEKRFAHLRAGTAG